METYPYLDVSLLQYAIERINNEISKCSKLSWRRQTNAERSPCEWLPRLLSVHLIIHLLLWILGKTRNCKTFPFSVNVCFVLNNLIIVNKLIIVHEINEYTWCIFAILLHLRLYLSNNFTKNSPLSPVIFGICFRRLKKVDESSYSAEPNFLIVAAQESCNCWCYISVLWPFCPCPHGIYL